MAARDPRDLMRERVAVARQRMVDDVKALAAELAPGGRARGKLWDGARNPLRHDRKPGSFVLYLTGEAAGGWKDYATHESGDLFDLVRGIHGLDFMQALAWAEDRYRIRAMTPEDRDRLKARAARPAALDTAEDLKRRTAGARRMWERGLALFSGDLAHRYFRARRCPLEEVPAFARQSFRLDPLAEWWPGATRDGTGRRVAGGPRLPALVSRFQDADGAGRAVHLTFLAADGSGKAAVDRPKLVWPNPEGLFIPLALGPDGRMPHDPEARPCPLVVTEGIEDAATLAPALPEARVVAAGSLWGLCTLPDMASASGFLLARDRDWGKGQAQEQFDFAAMRLGTTGKPVEVIEPTGGSAKDFNDMARGHR